MAKMNDLVVRNLKKLGNLYEIKGDRYRSLAYFKASRSVLELEGSVVELRDLTSLAWVGPSIAGKITEIIETGTCEKIEELRKAVTPLSISEFKQLPGIGMEGAKEIWNKYRVTNLDELSMLIEHSDAVDAKLVEAYQKFVAGSDRVPIHSALEAVVPLLARIRELPEVMRAELAGSIRRGLATVRDIDIVVCCRQKHRDTLVPNLREVLIGPGAGNVKLTGDINIHGTDRHVDIAVTDEDSWGACLMHLTGSKEHNILIRGHAKRKGLKVNEYGVWKGAKRVAGRSEIEVYRALGMFFIPPEKRESEWVRQALQGRMVI